MASIARQFDHPATRADLEALPANIKGEIIDGVLYTQARPRPRHQHLSSGILAKIFDPYAFGVGGPGGWWILSEPGIEIPGAPEISPDIAGWRRERLPDMPPDEGVAIAPDWVCEVLSPTNRSYDRGVKFPFYARVGVGHLWVVDPEARVVEVKRLIAGRWTEIAVFTDDSELRAEPFEGIAIPLGRLWLPQARRPS